MFEGKTFFPVTGIPMRKIACMSRLFALAEPVPFTVPILNAKSLTADMSGGTKRGGRRCTRRKRRRAHRRAALGDRDQSAGWRNVQLEAAHVPCGRRTALSTETAVEAHVFV